MELLQVLVVQVQHLLVKDLQAVMQIGWRIYWWLLAASGGGGGGGSGSALWIPLVQAALVVQATTSISRIISCLWQAVVAAGGT
jgi:hypothetical protein